MQEIKNQPITIFHRLNDFEPMGDCRRRPERSRKGRIPRIANKDIPIHTTYGYSFPNSVPKDSEMSEPKFWSTVDQHNYRELSEKKEKPMFNRTQYLLKQYLGRKQKQRFGVTLLRNPQSVDEPKRVQYKTMIDFRIKKPKKWSPSLAASPEIKLQEQDSAQLKKLDQSFLNMTYGKNLYEMTYEQLQRSINWKKQFLQNINRKIRQSRTSSLTNRMHF